MDLLPMDDRIIVEKYTVSETAGGIVLPNAKDKNMGKVLEVGPGAKLQNGERFPINLIKGDIVFFDNKAGTQIELNGQYYWVLRESEIFAKIC